jgi:NAD(P)-dependent dehydrogenase (short-subunit alcohol dehydrogenase family)
MRLPQSPRVVITGAASGLGRALALALAPRGAHLLLSDVDVGGCEETAGLASRAGAASARVQRCDVARMDDVAALAAACEGRVDLVVHNAGVASAGLVGELPLEHWQWTLAIDLWGVIHGCHAFVPMLRQQGSGHILNVASAAGLLSAPRMAAYNVAKAGVVALSETLAAELVGTGVGVTVLCPTFFRTRIAASGRYSDAHAHATATKLVDSGVTADEVARAAIAAVEKGALYAVPMADGRWIWRLKRLLPGAAAPLLGRWGQWHVERAAKRRTSETRP